ncbi:hypothetical protein FACS1894159_06330 [Bacteroidia bacterium]|nr:hypothetical protein FACS1894159_06330 [Bacteroidia bacterium]
MKKIALALSLLLFAGVAHPSKPVYRPGTPHAEARTLLCTWGEAMLACQLRTDDPALDGALLCPACGRIHGRCIEAALPFMCLAHETGEARWVEAARRVMRWGANVKMPDGGWMNDINVSDWNGTTVFAAIALYEALHRYGAMLDDSTRSAWREELRSAGEFIHSSDFIYSRRRGGWRNMNINYSASATYALHALGEMFAREDYKTKARLIASDMAPYFTREGFLYGEGQRMEPTSKGCLPVDLLYNVEESLPNLASYAVLSGDEATRALVERSMRTHLAFMLPDGGWDDSWGTRNFKWCYWGGRTSDGFMAGYYLLGGQYPAFDEAVMRNIRLLAASTRDGLLSGRDYAENGLATCIHHTVSHAKALASMLAIAPRPYKPCVLPREAASGATHFADIDTWLVSEGPWRATVTGYDCEYKVEGTHPMGGALSMLWHSNTGPVFAASMNLYSLVEAPNMQADRQRHTMCATPRVELIENGVMYSNLDDATASIASQGGSTLRVRAHLVDAGQRHPSAGPVEVEIVYEFTAQRITMSAHTLSKAPARMVLPLIAPRSWRVGCNGGVIEITDGARTVSVASPGVQLLPSNDGRILSLTPGFSFVPISVPLENGAATTVLTVN